LGLVFEKDNKAKQFFSLTRTSAKFNRQIIIIIIIIIINHEDDDNSDDDSDDEDDDDDKVAKWNLLLIEIETWDFGWFIHFLMFNFFRNWKKKEKEKEKEKEKDENEDKDEDKDKITKPKKKKKIWKTPRITTIRTQWKNPHEMEMQINSEKDDYHLRLNPEKDDFWN